MHMIDGMRYGNHHRHEAWPADDGIPAIPILEYNRLSVHFRNLEKYAGKLKEIEERIAETKD